MWDEITYPFPNFNGCVVEVLEWIINFISHVMMQSLLHAGIKLKLKLNHVGKKAPRNHLKRTVVKRTVWFCRRLQRCLAGCDVSTFSEEFQELYEAFQEEQEEEDIECPEVPPGGGGVSHYMRGRVSHYMRGGVSHYMRGMVSHYMRGMVNHYMRGRSKSLHEGQGKSLHEGAE